MSLRCAEATVQVQDGVMCIWVLDEKRSSIGHLFSQAQTSQRDPSGELAIAIHRYGEHCTLVFFPILSRGDSSTGCGKVARAKGTGLHAVMSVCT